MNHTAEVYLWGTRIGIIHQEPDASYSTFEYDSSFVKSKIELSPVRMPLSGAVYSFPELADTSFYGMPGLVADSLPDRFGNLVIEQWLNRQNRSLSDFNAIDRLCYTGKRGMGALEYVPANFNLEDIDETINVSEMVKFASDILNDRTKVKLNAREELTYSQLVQAGSSPGGARAKALIAWNEKTGEIRSGQLNLGEDFDYWLMKFDNVDGNGDHGIKDSPRYTLIEYAYYKMALDCGIKMNECRIYKAGRECHFMTKRFDRANGKKIHMQSLGAIAHIDYNHPGSCSYEAAAEYMRIMGLGADETEQLFRRMVFNCLAVNQDDHVKNISFLMDRNGKWSLSPAYDLTFSYNPDNRWLKAHQMTVNNKTANITKNDLLEAGHSMNLKRSKCKSIISEISSVTEKFDDYAEGAGVKTKTIDIIKETIKANNL